MKINMKLLGAAVMLVLSIGAFAEAISYDGEQDSLDSPYRQIYMVEVTESSHDSVTIKHLNGRIETIAIIDGHPLHKGHVYDLSVKSNKRVGKYVSSAAPQYAIWGYKFCSTEPDFDPRFEAVCSSSYRSMRK